MTEARETPEIQRIVDPKLYQRGRRIQQAYLSIRSKAYEEAGNLYAEHDDESAGEIRTLADHLLGAYDEWERRIQTEAIRFVPLEEVER